MIAMTPWVDRSFDFNFPVGLFPVIFSRLEGTLFRLAHLLSAAEDEFCSVQKNGWSVKEHVGHLFDLEELWWQRLDDFQNGKEILTAADMSNSKSYTAMHNEKSLEQLMNQFIHERQKLLQTIYYFDEPTLLVSSFHPRLKMNIRLVDSLYFVAEHDDHHLAVISELLRKPSS
jgi:uncharacterized damage-inducible protein DinB